MDCSLPDSQGQEPGGLLSMGLHRVGHDWSDLAAAAAMPLGPENLLSLLVGLGHQVLPHQSIKEMKYEM